MTVQAATAPVLNIANTFVEYNNSGPIIIAPSLIISGTTLDGARAVISTNFNANQDQLGIFNQSSTSGTLSGINWSYNSASGVLTLSGNADVATYQSVMRQITYSNTSGTPSLDQRTVQFTLGASLPCAGTHYYEFVNAPAIRWDDAKNAASTRSLFGQQGYLATINTKPENDCLTAKLEGLGWIGASDAAVEGEWRWVTGPVAEQVQFWQGAYNGSAVAGRYNAWEVGEPNDFGGEDYGHFLTNGKWNDYDIGTPVQGYLVEYGGMPGDPTLQITDDVIVKINTPPTVTNPGPQTTLEDTPISNIGVTVGDDQTAAASLLVEVLSSNATLVPDANIGIGGTASDVRLTFTPAPNQYGVTTITVKVTDESGLSTQVSFPLTVTPVNDGPTAQDDMLITDEDTPGSVNVLANDYDNDDTPSDAPFLPPSSLTIASGPTHGTATVVASTGILVYTPAPDYWGTDSLTYAVCDNGTPAPNACATATVHMSVTSVNDAPVTTVPGVQSAIEHTDTPIRGVSVADVDGYPDPIEVNLSSGNGTLTINAGVAGGLTVAGITDNGTSSVVLRGTLAQINATLAHAAGLVYRSVLGFTGTDALIVETNDLGARGSGGPRTDTDIIPITVGALIDLDIAKSIDTPTIASIPAGGDLAYTIVVTNTGPSAAHDVVLTDTLSAGISIVSVEPSVGTCSNTDTILCDLGTMAPDARESIRIVAAAKPTTRGTVAMVAAVSSTTPELNIINNRFTETTSIVGQAALDLQMSASPSPVIAGTNITYTMVITNTGPSTSNATLANIVPADIIFRSATVSRGSCTQSGSVVCTLGILDVNDVVVVQIVGTVRPESRGQLTTISSVKGDDATTNFAVVVTDIVPQAELSITQRDAPPLISTSEPLTYVMTVRNDGPSTATGATITAKAPLGATILSTTVELGVCKKNVTTSCTLGILLPGETRTLTVVVKLDRPVTTTVSIVAVEPDPVATNNITLLTTRAGSYSLYIVHLGANIPLPPTTAPDLVVNSITLSPNKTTFKAGEAVQLSITFSNIGTAPSTPVWADLYLNPDPAPTGANQQWNIVCGMDPCLGIVWRVPALQPGESITLTSAPDAIAAGYHRWPGWFAAGTTDVYVYVDSYKEASTTGAVIESDETNNRAELHGLTVTGKNPILPQSLQLSTLVPRPDPATVVP